MTKVAIRVIDVNDNAPRIVLNDRAGDAEVTVEEEGTAGSFVAHISVSDADSGSNGAVQCALMESDEFTMERLYDGEYKVRTSRSLDREARADYELEIICHDGGSPQRTTSARLRVKVADINDNPPRFLQEEYFGVVAEGGDSGMYVVRCDASDPDGGRNGTIRYRLDRDAGSVFTIDSQTGIIRTTMAVDRELTEVYVFRVIAQDLGAEQRTATALVSVAVTDVDDQPPRFEQRSITLSILENQPPDTEVYKCMTIRKLDVYIKY